MIGRWSDKSVAAWRSASLWDLHLSFSKWSLQKTNFRLLSLLKAPNAVFSRQLESIFQSNLFRPVDTLTSKAVAFWDNILCNGITQLRNWKLTCLPHFQVPKQMSGWCTNENETPFLRRRLHPFASDLPTLFLEFYWLRMLPWIRIFSSQPKGNC